MYYVIIRRCFTEINTWWRQIPRQVPIIYCFLKQINYITLIIAYALQRDLITLFKTSSCP